VRSEDGGLKAGTPGKKKIPCRIPNDDIQRHGVIAGAPMII
jgi:hypothetical protein